MNKKFDKLGFYPADILLPKGLWRWHVPSIPFCP